MTITLLEQSKHESGNAPVLDTRPTSITENRNRLVARWLIDENSKLYCQWVTED